MFAKVLVWCLLRLWFDVCQGNGWCLLRLWFDVCQGYVLMFAKVIV